MKCSTTQSLIINSLSSLKTNFSTGAVYQYLESTNEAYYMYQISCRSDKLCRKWFHLIESKIEGGWGRGGGGGGEAIDPAPPTFKCSCNFFFFEASRVNRFKNTGVYMFGQNA